MSGTKFSKEIFNKAHDQYEKWIKEQTFEGLTYRKFYDMRHTTKVWHGDGFDGEKGVVKIKFNDDPENKLHDAYYQKVIIQDSRFLYDVLQKL